jgi:hypothetical protein
VRDQDQADLAWRSSSSCWNSQCVAVGTQNGRILVKDTSDAHETILSINQRDWADFVTRIRHSMKVANAR